MYPVPSYAAHVWVVGDEIHLALPPIDSNQQGHTVKAPATEKGLGILLRILSDRQRQSRPRTVSTPAAPTQYQIEEWLKAVKKAPAKKAVPESVTELVELDFSTEEIEAELARRKHGTLA